MEASPGRGRLGEYRGAATVVVIASSFMSIYKVKERTTSYKCCGGCGMRTSFTSSDEGSKGVGMTWLFGGLVRLKRVGVEFKYLFYFRKGFVGNLL